MNLIKKLQNLQTRLDSTRHNAGILEKSLLPTGLLCLVALVIWFGGPFAAWGHYSPLALPEKRIYLILLISLLWLLKFLLIDLDIPNPFHYNDAVIRAKLIDLQNRFQGAAKFLDKSFIPGQAKKMKLGELPCYLLLGPVNAGKTSLLLNSGMHFILQKHYQPQELLHPNPTENCDWWVTREASIIDVPGKYLSTNDGVSFAETDEQVSPALWNFFLRLMKKKRGKQAINGIIIALPAPEIIKQLDNKNYPALIRDLFQRIQDVQKMFARPMVCQLVITKCDLLPGFTEFFAETSTEESSQVFGVTLPVPKENENLAEVFTTKFNTLIKNLNQQLLWRLHQERNPFARPAIKDFPLQVERIKEFTADFIKKLSIIRLDVALKGVYLTSAVQPEPTGERSFHSQPIESSTRVIEIFREPITASRTYFVKQFFTHSISHANHAYETASQLDRWKIRAAYASSIGVIALVASVLGKDFQQGIKQNYALQQNLADYQHQIVQISNPAEHLISSIHLLNTLHPYTDKPGFRLDLSWLVSIYSHQSQKKTAQAYQSALRNVLLPEIKNYFEEYLVVPVNKSADDIYAVLKAYLMMGEAKQFDAQHVTSTLQKILPKSMQENESLALMNHLKTSFVSDWTSMPLDNKKIERTRKYLAGLPPLKLSYIILKNMDGNNADSEIQLEKFADNTPIFANQQLVTQIPVMFTAKMFNPILTQQVNVAAKETTTGNWVLGDNTAQHHADIDPMMLDQLRIRYVSQYIETWENLLDNIHLSIPADLATTDAMIVSIISNHSPFLHLLKTVHDNTNFEPIILSSPKLQRIVTMVDKTDDTKKALYIVFASMQSLHQYLQSILHAENVKQAAYDAVSTRMSSHSKPDAITQLRVIAEDCPSPIRQWLVRITDNSWSYLIQEAGQYLDISWNTQVMPYYRSEIAGRYPFNLTADQDVNFHKFTEFFGSPGIVLGFYNKYLQRFVDTSTADWHWRQIDGRAVPFSVETLRQIQYALRIHNAFFPKGDNKLYVQFAMQPYKFGRPIKSVSINFDEAQFTDEYNSRDTHLVTLQDDNKLHMSSVQLTLEDDRTINRQYKGHWGWFKMLNQSYESALTKREMLINLSMDEHPAKYILSAEGQYNPLLSLNLQLFHLPQQLTDEKA